MINALTVLQCEKMLSDTSQPMAEADILDRAPMFSPAEHFVPGMKVPSDYPSTQKTQQQVLRDTASDWTDYTGFSESDRSREQFTDRWNSAYDASFVPGPLKQSSAEPLFRSWWPVPDRVMMVEENFNGTNHEESIAVGHRPNLKRRPSVFKRLENRLEGFVFGPHGHVHHAATASPSGDVDTETRGAISKVNAPFLNYSTVSDSLFHVVLTTSHFKKDVNSKIQGVRICGTYDSLPAAKAFAHRCIFDAGYEQEWFMTSETQHGLQLVNHREDKIVKATGPGGEVFVVSVSTIPNIFGLKSTNDTNRIQTQLYHVVQTIIHYYNDESGQTRDTTIQGSFPTYDRACEIAHTLLLWWEDGIDKITYALYEEAGVGELDCGYGENVVVHAVGQNGENFLVSVLKGQEMEAERVSEAAMAMCA